jgi:pimeloyl-ACP methyl ester carboxylesterase
MEPRDDEYTQLVQRAEDKLLHFLRTFEAVQEEIHLARVGDSQARLQEAVGDLFSTLTADLATLSPSESLKDFHAKLSEAVTCCAEAYATFLSGKGQNIGQSFLDSRRAHCRGLYLLYDLRVQLPVLQQYWVLPDVLSALATLETRTLDVEVPVGFSHKPRTNTRAEYSLYVPENYSPQQSWPLIVCLHGGYGRGDDYILTWLRPAKSNGYLLLSPKSVGPTWSVLNPPLDIRSIQAMLEEVCAAYAVDRKRTYLTGLSDGGIFTYVLGLACADLFAGIAPIAGELHPMVDPMLRRGQGKDVPIFVVHGAHDSIFSVEFTRQACTLLQRLGYKVTYQELPDWGHAYTYKINEQLVLPWFASLGEQ